MQFELMASMMCADYGHLADEVRALEEGGIDSFHIDIMDGRYVPNYAMSLCDMQYIRSATKLPLDVHLMIEHPWDGACGADKVKEFAPKGVKGFVLGTTLLFGKDRPYGDILQEIRALEI